MRLCEIESPSGRERGMADAVGAELARLGLEVEEDDSAAPRPAPTPATSWPASPGRRARARSSLCAHLDTVPLAAPVEVARENGVLTNRHEAILGADNKAAVATMLGGGPAAGRATAPGRASSCCSPPARSWRCAAPRPSTAAGCAPSSASCSTTPRPVGELVVASPTYYRLDADFRGQAAHAGIRPEAGRTRSPRPRAAVAAMRLGRLDAETTANVGQIEGGTAANVVAERCQVELEARSLDDGRAGEW